MLLITRQSAFLTVSTILVIGLGQVVFGDSPSPNASPTSDQTAAFDRITANSLRGHLSFIASDLLEGRDTPSRGLDIAAEYIAAQFRRAGLEPVGDDGYFQTANWRRLDADADSFRLEIKIGNTSPILIGKSSASAERLRAFDVSDDRVFKIDIRDPKSLQSLTANQVEGRAVFVELPEAAPRSRTSTVIVNGFMSRMTSLKAAIVVNVSRQVSGATGFAPGRAFDPGNTRAVGSTRTDRPGPPLITVHDAGLIALFDSLPLGASDKPTVSAHLEEPITNRVRVRNVAGLLRGSDPMLKDAYVLVTAHYDHIGNRTIAGDKSDQLFNGANDDGSGTVSVVELASSLATLKTKPKRSILFMTFFGEEKGLLGSRHYGRNPIVPIAKTIADVNLEQVGRTDDSEGPRIGAAVMTGHGFSQVSDVFTAAGDAEGVKVSRHPRFSDAFFSRSDNKALADLGVPAHTICVAFTYPDYHGAGDHWEKVDYDNMAKVDRMVAHGLLMLANNPISPQWNESNPKAAKYLKAWKKSPGQ